MKLPIILLYAFSWLITILGLKLIPSWIIARTEFGVLMNVILIPFVVGIGFLIITIIQIQDELYNLATKKRGSEE